MILLMMYGVSYGHGQTPTHYPTGKNPVDFSLGNIILYIVFPLLLVGAWIIIRRSGRRKKKDNSSIRK